jgi:HAD superfamily hydrolase (TIGR01509 family)
MAYKTVIFDWDGCLAMTLEMWVATYHDAFKPYGVRLKDDQVITLAADWDAIGKLGVSDVVGFRALINSQIALRFAETSLYPYAKLLLSQLKRQGIRLGLATSSERSDILKAIAFHGIGDLFDSIVCGDDVKNHKPHPESIMRVMKELNALPESTLMVGDSIKDIIAATEAQIDSSLIFHDTHDRYYSLETLQSSNPMHTFHGFNELAQFMKEPII